MDKVKRTLYLPFELAKYIRLEAKLRGISGTVLIVLALEEYRERRERLMVGKKENGV